MEDGCAAVRVQLFQDEIGKTVTVKLAGPSNVPVVGSFQIARQDRVGRAAANQEQSSRQGP
jgi:hypothetical protein